MAWAKLATKTLAGSASNVTTDTFTASKFNQTLGHVISTGSTMYPYQRYSGNANNVYAYRYNENGAVGADQTSVSTSGQSATQAGTANSTFVANYICSITGEEKLIISFFMESGTAGAGNAPKRVELVGKFVPSPDANITEYKIYDYYSASYLATDTNATVLGSDATASNSIQNGLEFHETDTNKDYVFN